MRITIIHSQYTSNSMPPTESRRRLLRLMSTALNFHQPISEVFSHLTAVLNHQARALRLLPFRSPPRVMFIVSGWCTGNCRCYSDTRAGAHQPRDSGDSFVSPPKRSRRRPTVCLSSDVRTASSSILLPVPGGLEIKAAASGTTFVMSGRRCRLIGCGLGCSCSCLQLLVESLLQLVLLLDKITR